LQQWKSRGRKAVKFINNKKKIKKKTNKKKKHAGAQEYIKNIENNIKLHIEKNRQRMTKTNGYKYTKTKQLNKEQVNQIN